MEDDYQDIGDGKSKIFWFPLLVTIFVVILMIIAITDKLIRCTHG